MEIYSDGESLLQGWDVLSALFPFGMFARTIDVNEKLPQADFVEVCEWVNTLSC